MALPESWRRMKDDFVPQTEAWGRGISEEMSFLGSRLKEFWADPEKAISIPAEQGDDLATLAGIVPYLGLKLAKETLGAVEKTMEQGKKGYYSTAPGQSDQYDPMAPLLELRG